MIARSGVRRSVALVRSGAAAFVFAVAGCSGESLLVGQERPQSDPGTDEPYELGSSRPAVPPPDVELIRDCPASLEGRLAQPGCWPTPHVGSWRGFFLGVPRYATTEGVSAEFPPGGVLLQIADDGLAQLTFGAQPEGSLASTPPLAPCAPGATAEGCSTPGLVIAGFAYPLRELELHDPELAPEPRIAGEPPLERAESMSFVVAVSEPWDAWCAQQGLEETANCSGGDCSAGGLPAPGVEIDSTAAPPDLGGCRCDAKGCRAEAPSLPLSIALQMSLDGDALRGRYGSSGAPLGDAWLELRRAPER